MTSSVETDSAAILDQAETLAQSILDEARTTLMASLRFMDVALWAMPCVPKPLRAPLGTDGIVVYFDPVRVISAYRESPNEVLRCYLQTVMHCVFHHPFDNKHPNHRLWDTACDIAVEAAVLELCGLLYPCENDAELRREIDRIKESVAQLTARKLYHAFSEQLENSTSDKAARTIERLAALFARDDHAVWTRGRKRNETLRVLEKTTLFNDGTDNSVTGQGADEAEVEESKHSDDVVNMPGEAAPSQGGSQAEGSVANGDSFSLSAGEDTYEAIYGSLDEADYTLPEAQKWKDISQQIQLDMELFLSKCGNDPGTFLVNLSVSNRKQYDYRDFLKRFSSRSEEMKVSPDEFDYIYYTFGLRKYKNMPLIEPLEYQESDRVRDFVIAVDTSASCASGLVRLFMEKTYDVLKSSEGFGRKINVHIVQCDSDIRKVTKITSLKEIDDTFMDCQARGFGGTDFRPVFNYVNDMIEHRELSKLKGLIYLTDGLGKFPDKPPEYDTVFVFINEQSAEKGAPHVPPWAMKVIMDEEDIIEL